MNKQSIQKRALKLIGRNLSLKEIAYLKQKLLTAIDNLIIKIDSSTNLKYQD